MNTIYRMVQLDGKPITKDVRSYGDVTHFVYFFNHTWELVEVTTDWTTDVPSGKLITYKFKEVRK